MALLEVSNLNVTILDPISQTPVQLIENFSLTLQAGDIVGLIGETGSGKTVIAQILSGNIKNTWQIHCQSFRFNGKELLTDNNTLDTKPLASLVGMIYQNPEDLIDPTQTIGEQIYYRMKLATANSGDKYHKKEATKYLNELLTRIGKNKEQEKFLRSYYSDLSETDAHLVVIIMTVVANPLFIIADEPTTGLSFSSAQKVQKLLQRINAKYNKTILYLSNNYENVKDLVSAAVFLYFGQIVEKVSDIKDIANNLLDYCHHPYTLLFLKSLPNFKDQNLIFKQKLYAIPGQLPELDNMPVGCRFGPRCELSQRECMRTPVLTKDREQGYSEFACYNPINYLTPQESLEIREVREKIKKELEKQLEDC